MSKTSIVSVTNLSKRYGSFTAVNGISFSIRRGEIFGFLGPNGAGKTTTINMMIGLARPSDGSVKIDGNDAVKNVKKAQSIMGIVPDESNLYDEMDGFDNLCFCGSLYGMRKAERENRAKALLEQFDLTQAGKRSGCPHPSDAAWCNVHRCRICDCTARRSCGICCWNARPLSHTSLCTDRNGSARRMRVRCCDNFCHDHAWPFHAGPLRKHPVK